MKGSGIYDVEEVDTMGFFREAEFSFILVLFILLVIIACACE
ncbi:sporulation protein YjcZ [Aneurinibacillus tyrosinisolvens]